MPGRDAGSYVRPIVTPRRVVSCACRRSTGRRRTRRIAKQSCEKRISNWKRVASSAQDPGIEPEGDRQRLLGIARGEWTECSRRRRGLDGALCLGVEAVHTGAHNDSDAARRHRAVAIDEKENFRVQGAALRWMKSERNLPHDV